MHADRKTAELKFRTPDGASVGMKLNGIEYKGHKAVAWDRSPKNHRALNCYVASVARVLSFVQMGILEIYSH